jgi:PKD repeat protein
VVRKLGCCNRARRLLSLSLFLLLALVLVPYRLDTRAAVPGSVIINEVAWMGTLADANDEWIELLNTTDEPIDLTGWRLVAGDGAPQITLSGVIPAHGFFLLERTDDTTVSDLVADQIYTGALSNSGEALFLKDPAGNLIDSANSNSGSWPAGNSSSRSTMERIDPFTPDSDANWATNNGIIRNGLDAVGKPINGTPKAPNSTINVPPMADAGPDQIIDEGTLITLDGSRSTDPNGDPLTCTWDPADGTGLLSGCTTTHTYSDDGIYTVVLFVDDGRGETSSDTAQIQVLNVPPIVQLGPDQTATVGQILHFTGSIHDPGTHDTHTLQWDFGDGIRIGGTLTPTHSYATDGVYTVTLTVTDDDGGVGMATLTVRVRPPLRLGDANGNGALELEDASLCAEIALQLRTPTPEQEIVCDVAAPSGTIDGRDVIWIASQ